MEYLNNPFLWIGGLAVGMYLLWRRQNIMLATLNEAVVSLNDVINAVNALVKHGQSVNEHLTAYGQILQGGTTKPERVISIDPKLKG